MLKEILLGPFDWFLFTVLTEKQRSALSEMLSADVRTKLKKIFLGKKARYREQIETYKYYLYNLGFTEKALHDLEKFFLDMNDPYIKRLVAWELILWYANQNTKEDVEKALPLFSVASYREKNVDQIRRLSIIKAECLGRIGEVEKAKLVIEEMLEKNNHPDLYLAMVNLVENIEQKLVLINKVYEIYDLPHISLTNKNQPIYDGLKSENSDHATEGPKITVIIPAYNAEIGIKTAIDSILNQTWQNIELIIVDDNSTDGTRDVVQEYVNQDFRVKLLSTPSNSGPYIARNIALKEATGEFVTINDSDDWSHSKKLEIQVKHLIENKHVIANTSEHARLTEDFLVYRRGTRGKYIFSNMSSIMFRRKPVIETIGFWDSVRFAADGEFKRRLIKTFGKDKYVDLNTGPLSLPRQTLSSLTGSSAFGYNGYFMGARKEYVDSLEYYHKNAVNLYYPPVQEKRLFPVPEPMLPKRKVDRAKQRYVESILVSDFRYADDEWTSQIFGILEKNAVDQNLALVQMYNYDLTVKRDINSYYRSKIDGNNVQMLVFGENIICERMIITNPKLVEEYQKYIPIITANRIEIVMDEALQMGNEEKSKVEEAVKRYFNVTTIDWISYQQFVN
ncbi:glycosyltransferase family A protein [Ornithinibacillus sp. FSL M8-0202]|uniref:glycosyltransferase family 2 protein n=1 Tax=Ornithinibacillus sp. FSL M8-0202 TaxID=2921616 RepID=UPI0030CEA7DF